MQPFFGPPFSSMPMQAPMQGMSQAANMFSSGGHMSPMTGVGSQAMRGGGLLSKLLGGLGGASNAVSAPAMGGGLSPTGAASGMNFTTMLTNAQKVLGLTQQVMPMVQQYGPLIRNAPALWKIMRSNNSEDEPNPVQEQAPSVSRTEIPIEDEVSFSSASEQALSKETLSSEKVSSTRTKTKTIDGIPAPKLYV